VNLIGADRLPPRADDDLPKSQLRARQIVQRKGWGYSPRQSKAALAPRLSGLHSRRRNDRARAGL